MNDGISVYIGAEPKETIIDIILTALHLDECNAVGKLIYLLGRLDNNNNLLQKMIFAVIFLFGVFIINSILSPHISLAVFWELLWQGFFFRAHLKQQWIFLL